MNTIHSKQCCVVSSHSSTLYLVVVVEIFKHCINLLIQCARFRQMVPQGVQCVVLGAQ